MAFEDTMTNDLTLKTVTEEDVAFDDCYNTNCKYYNVDKELCTFETCLFKELPKHPRSIITECIICKTKFECNIEDTRVYICPECLTALRHIIHAHRNICTECEPIKPEEENVNQYLKEGDDPSNEDWNH